MYICMPPCKAMKPKEAHMQTFKEGFIPAAYDQGIIFAQIDIRPMHKVLRLTCMRSVCKNKKRAVHYQVIKQSDLGNAGPKHSLSLCAR
ncbi:hypothetical protein COCSUDRAFT_52551 [Coccomyxa subellipsoidea C-169]|uniref:Uncharacterized protein n=1 Tax=Coccomyxa subellipsoidea (strain C-169) TaxID=574566 RepID=I0Z4Z5_COCSC|nr:hypothetical protein COCSUDRAFT_52551 [Coccomyxa subellipsoidea C-169]EIE25714.1 hypothetical protein COCSUDRAFT_52551 [Coccomyxa subellipsoidea C-169]|eukprot:XP_005650258.1 hypothetical protein COCSUDRAFT_52551 [Coccomyxa subellipsoidea C-169]